MATKPKLKPRESIFTYFEDLGRYYELQLLGAALKIAEKYADRGQVDHSIEHLNIFWGQKDHSIDSLNVQTMLKSPLIGHAQILKAQLKWASYHAISMPDDDTFKFIPFDGRRKIRVAYACCWFNSSTIRGQALPFIAAHDREKFSIIGYSLDLCDASVTKYFDEFYVVKSDNDLGFASRVRSDQIDILIELTGFSPYHRMGAMGARCAPVQISYLNHTGTSGVQNIDYVFADFSAAPEGIDKYFTEKIYRLPNTFFCFNYDWDVFPEIGVPPHLKNGYITFGCFGSQSKINDAIIRIWARLLDSVPNSKLFLRNMGLSNAENRRFLTRRFMRWGVSADRLRLEPGGEREEIKANYNEVDISLDTWPYCGGNTIAESQWMGVPVVTLKGDRFPAAYGSSLLKASGCEDLIADTVDDYISVATKLAKDSQRICFFRSNLRQMMVEYGFGDPLRFVKDIEFAYVQMLKQANQKS